MNKYVLGLLNSLPRPGAIISTDLIIWELNDKFKAQIGDLKGKHAVDSLTTGRHKERFKSIFSGTQPGWKGAEVLINLADHPALCWCENHSFIADGHHRHFLEVVSVEKLQTLEATYLNKLRRVLDDNLFILDDEGMIIWHRSADQGYGNCISSLSAESILEEDRPKWNKALAAAKKKPGQGVEVTVKVKLDGSIRYIDLCYVPGTLMGGRFYMASRRSVPSGSRIIDRLKEAWAVDSDEELARRLGVAKNDIGQATSETNVPPDWLVKTGQLTGFSIDWLLTGYGERRRSLYL